MGDDASSERKGRKNREQAPHRVFLLEIFRRASAINEPSSRLARVHTGGNSFCGCGRSTADYDV
jgi:hypothetical protein